MRKDIRGRVKEFLTSEVGQVGIRAPLVLGVASGTVLLSQMVYTPSAEANFNCWSDSDCDTGESCELWCVESIDGTCTKWRTDCVPKSDS